MSVYTLSSRISSVEYSVDELGQKADSFNAVLAGTTTVNGPAFLNGPVAFGNSITGIDISDVKDLQTALDAKADESTTYTKSDVDTALGYKADKSTTYTKSDADTALGYKANQLTTYTKSDVDTSLGQKADKSNTYTKSDVDTALGYKADKSNTNTKTEVNE